MRRSWQHHMKTDRWASTASRNCYSVQSKWLIVTSAGPGPVIICTVIPRCPCSQLYPAQLAPFLRINSYMFARLYVAVSRVVPQVVELVLPANAKGIPNPVAFRDWCQQFEIRLVLRERHTHEAPVSEGEESGLSVER